MGVILEAKRPDNKAEMFSKSNTRAKVLREVVLYFLREWTAGEHSIKSFIITNYDEWYIFRAANLAAVYEGSKELQAEWQAYNSIFTLAFNVKKQYTRVRD